MLPGLIGYRALAGAALSLLGCSIVEHVDRDEYSGERGRVALVARCNGNPCPAADVVTYGATPGKCPDLSDSLDGLIASAGSAQQARGYAGEALGLSGVTQQASAFFVALRDESCEVTWSGCVEATLGTQSEIQVPLRAAGTAPFGACLNGACPCTDTSVADGLGDGTCSLLPVAAGELPVASSRAAVVSGPALLATSTSFVVGYRESDAAGVRFVSAAVSLDGVLGRPFRTDLTDFFAACAGDLPEANIAAAFDQKSGTSVFVLTRPDCEGSGKAGLIVLGARDDGRVSNVQPVVDAGAEIALAPRNALSQDASGLSLAYVQGGLARIARVDPTSLMLGSVQELGSASDFVMLDRDASGLTASLSGGPDASRLSVSTANPGVANGLALPGTDNPGVAAWSGGAVAVVAESNHLRWASVAPDAQVATSSGTLELGAAAIAGAVSLSGTELVWLGSAVGDFTLGTLDRAATGAALKPASGHLSGKNSAVLSDLLAAFDGSRVVMVSGQGRVAVSWLNGTEPAGAAPGGFLILDCG